MTDVLDPRSMLEAAQEAAGAGDYHSAERLLREAAVIQENSLGSLHPDLASTLNNLASVCERTDKFAEAEQGYRRAHAIAVASLAPGHPFVATSLKNLLDFCVARGIPVWTPPAAQAGVETSSPNRSAKPRPEVPSGSELRLELAPVTKEIAPRTIPVAALGAGVVVAVLLTLLWWWTSDSSRPFQEAERPSLLGSQSTPSSTTPAPTRDPQPTVTLETSRGETPAPVERPEGRGTTTAPAQVTVLNAQLCRALEKQGSPDWQCASVSGDLQPGTYHFYTRLQSNVDTTVEHRWYRDERVHQVMRLRVGANQSSGYRTFSSNTVSPDRAGDWKVELRAADGTLLREEHFVIH